MNNTQQNQSNTSLKVLYIVPRFHPFKGGAESNFLALARRMVKQGHDVTVYTTNIKFRNEKLTPYANFNGIKIIRHWAFNEALYLGVYPRLFTRLLNSKFDVIHVSGFGFIWVEICLSIKRLFAKKTLFINTPHGPFMALGDSKGLRGFAKSFYTRILRFLIPKIYDVIVAVVPKQKDWMTKDYGIDEKKIFTIPNGIDEEYIAQKPYEHLKHEPVVITFMNRMEWYKGIQDVLQALEIIRRKQVKIFESLRFYIMGRPGGYTAKLKSLIEQLNLEEKVKFIYSPSDEERDRVFYEESQINILPSKWEATGIVLLEAMAKGNAIITTNQNEAVDLLITEKTGKSYNFADIKALSQCIIEIVSNFNDLQKIRENNIQFAKRFTWEAVFPRYEALVKDCFHIKNKL